MQPMHTPVLDLARLPAVPRLLAHGTALPPAAFTARAGAALPHLQVRNLSNSCSDRLQLCYCVTPKVDAARTFAPL
jgi:hypothetical protein